MEEEGTVIDEKAERVIRMFERFVHEDHAHEEAKKEEEEREVEAGGESEEAARVTEEQKEEVQTRFREEMEKAKAAE